MANPSFPSNYIGGYTSSIYNEIKNYQSVLKGPDKAVYDADLNDDAYMLLNQRRRLIQDLFGNGVIGDMFKPFGTSAVNDFTIYGSGSVSNPPTELELSALDRAYLAGYSMIAPVTSAVYTGWNALVNNSLGSAPAALTTPVGNNRTDTIQVHVYKKEVTGTDDSDLIASAYGLTASVANRERLIIQIEVVEGTPSPTPVAPAITADNIDGNGVAHHYMKIGEIRRLASVPNITAAMVIDMRESAVAGEMVLNWIPAEGYPDVDGAAYGTIARTTSGERLGYYAFDPDIDMYMRSTSLVPEDMDTSKPLALRIGYMTPVGGAGNVQLELTCSVFAEGADPASAAAGEVTDTILLAAPGDADTHIVTYLDSIAASAFAAGGKVMNLRFHRDATNGTDTLAEDFRVFDISILYTKKG